MALETTIEAAPASPKRPRIARVVSRVNSWKGSRKRRNVKSGFHPINIEEILQEEEPAAPVVINDEADQAPSYESIYDTLEQFPRDSIGEKTQEECGPDGEMPKQVRFSLRSKMAGESEVIAAPASKNPPSIIDRFREAAAKYPDQLAVVCTHQAAGLYGRESLMLNDDAYRKTPYLRWTYDDLARCVRCFAAALVGQGVQKGTPIFLFLENQVEYVIATLAAYTLGLMHVPVNPSCLESPSDLQHMIRTVMEYQSTNSAVFLAADWNIAKSVDLIQPEGLEVVKIIAGNHWRRWKNLKMLMDKHSKDASYNFVENELDMTVLFTSGDDEDAPPNGCMIPATIWADTLTASLSLGSLQPTDRVVVGTPNNRAFGWISLMIPLLHGTPVVFAGWEFSTEATVDAIQQEKCTFATLDPTMLHRVAQMKIEHKKEINSLRGILFSEMSLVPEFLRVCKQDLGVPSVENLFSTPEGVFACTGSITDTNPIINMTDVSVGYPVHGCHLRVCAPGERKPLRKGRLGQLHFASAGVIEGYMGIDTDDFYVADGKIWFITGDQAFVDVDNRLYITDRTDDPVPPTKDELPTVKMDAFTDESVHIETAKEVAKEEAEQETKEVTQDETAKDNDTKDDTKVESPQPSPVLEKVAVATEKPVVVVNGNPPLVKRVSSTRRKYGTDLTNKVILEWSRVLGLEVSQIDINMSISTLADSVLLLSARDRIRKETGRSVSVAEWMAVDTIVEQIQLLEQVPPRKNTQIPHIVNRETPPSVDDIVHLGGDPDALESTKTAVESVISAHGLSWDDVEDVMPTTDYVAAMCKSRTMDRCRLSSSMISRDADAQQLRSALEAVLALNPILTSFFVGHDEHLGSDVSLHVTIRQTKAYLDRCIEDCGTINTMQEVKQLILNPKDNALLPGPLFKAQIAFVPEINSHVLITYISHAVIDKTYHDLFTEDIDRALSKQALVPHVPFKQWADSYHTLRNSPMAKTAIRFHTNYLQDIHDHKHALWPHPTKNLTVSAERADHDGHFLSFSAPSILRLRDQGVTPPTVMKAALALLAIYHTNHTHAIFANFEGVRKQYPFVPESYGFSDAADVGGPTCTGVINLIEYNPSESVLAYLQRMQHTQSKLTQHASVPWNEVFRKIGGSPSETISSITNSLNFNWMPGLGAMVRGGNPYSKIEGVQTSARTNIGMMVHAGTAGDDGSEIAVLIQGAVANISTQWVTRVGEDLKKIALWISEEKSLLESVGGFADALH